MSHSRISITKDNNIFMNKSCLYLLSLVIVGCAFYACADKKPKFEVSGVIENAENEVLYLEQRTLGEPLLVDSIILDQKGEFKFESGALPYPEFFKLRVGNQNINFVVDSVEQISIKGDLKNNLALNYDIEGSYPSKLMKDVAIDLAQLEIKLNELESSLNNKKLTELQFAEQANNAIDEFKKKQGNVILNHFKNPIGYYIVHLRLNNSLIYDPYNKKDLTYYRSVATLWSNNYSASPRTKALEQYVLMVMADMKTLSNQQALMEKLVEQDVEDASELYTVELPNINGDLISTRALKSKPVILDFSIYNSDYANVHNAVLNNINNKFKNQIEIYQVSFDKEPHIWKNYAAQLPWICVRDQAGFTSPLISKFNITIFPTTYLMDAKGNIVKRFVDGDNMEKEIQKVINSSKK